MSNSEKILKSLSTLIENGILTSKDIKNEISDYISIPKINQNSSPDSLNLSI